MDECEDDVSNDIVDGKVVEEEGESNIEIKFIRHYNYFVI
jgi:hypothetical protein